MRHKTSGYFLLSALLVSLILGLCILLNLRCPQAVSDDALTQEQLTRGVTLTGWQQTGPGHWRFAFEAPADVPELVLCLSTRLLDAVQFAVIRGNASEIRALAQRRAAGSGVDVSDADQITEKTLPRTVASARALAVQTGAVVAVSGPIDVLTDGRETILLHNGCATMSRVTGSGCMLTALMGAFCGAMPGQPFAAACAAAATMGVAGELAEARRLAHGTGNATFRTDLIDAVFNLTPAQLDASVRWESYSK